MCLYVMYMYYPFFFPDEKTEAQRGSLFPEVPQLVPGGTFQLLRLGSQPLWVSVSFPSSVSCSSSVTVAMDQPAGLQVDYVFRGVEHAVRVMVSGQVLELEVEDRMTADQWRGEFDASCECAYMGGLACPSPGSTSPRR